MNRTNTRFWQGFAAAVIGCVAGLVIAYLCWPGHWWNFLISAVVCGSIGYLVVDLEELVAGWRQVWTTSASDITDATRQVGIFFFRLLVLAIVSASWIGVLYLVLHSPWLSHGVHTVGFWLINMAGLAGILSIVIMFAGGLGSLSDGDYDLFWIIMRRCNPVAAIWYYPKYFVIFIWLLCLLAWWLVTKALPTVFRLIHSNERLIAMASGLIGLISGILVKSFFPGLLVGTVVTAVVNNISYHLVAVRWLKTLPVRA